MPIDISWIVYWFRRICCFLVAPLEAVSYLFAHVAFRSPERFWRPHLIFQAPGFRSFTRCFVQAFYRSISMQAYFLDGRSCTAKFIDGKYSLNRYFSAAEICLHIFLVPTLLLFFLLEGWRDGGCGCAQRSVSMLGLGSGGVVFFRYHHTTADATRVHPTSSCPSGFEVC